MTVTATPTTAAEWEEYVNTALATPESAKAAFDDGSFKRAQTAYQTAFLEAQNSSMADLQGQLRAQVAAGTQDLLKKNGSGIKNKLESLVAKHGNPNAPGTGLNGKYDSPVAFFQNALLNPSSMHGDELKKRGELQNYSSSTGEGGGYLIPEEWRRTIFEGPELENAVVRPRATVIPMSSTTLHFPAIDFSTEVGEVFGGMVFYWMDEGGTIPTTDALFAQIELHAHRLAGAAAVPNDTLKDSAALDTWLRTALPRGIREFEDRAFLKGDGVKKPLGALHAANPSLIVAGDETGQSTATITWNNVLAMFSRMLPEAYDNAVWVIDPSAIPEIYTMAVEVGTGGAPVMTNNAAVAPDQTLLGIPIKWSRKSPATLGTQGDISLADFRYYAIGDRQDVRVDTSEHVQFLQDNTVFKVIERVDGQPLLLSPLTPENGGPTLSAFVQLETRATD
jgi:HK97 family phage major capsid protein